jgi:hypothetical protein
MVAAPRLSTPLTSLPQSAITVATPTGPLAAFGITDRAFGITDRLCRPVDERQGSPGSPPHLGDEVHTLGPRLRAHTDETEQL